MSPVPRHQVIAASAGSGKTERLALRYLLLLARGVAPERIVALTFSRKAAGEILQRIVQRLCDWCDDPAAFARRAEGVTLPTLSAAEARGLLRRLLLALHRLRVGTLDSFFVSVVNAFPFEFGLTGELNIVDAGTVAPLQRRVLRRLLFDESAPATARAFLAEFGLATVGAAERSLASRVGDFARAAHDAILRLPDASQWGHGPTIWPDGLDLLDPAAEEAAVRAAAGLDLERLNLAAGANGVRQRERLAAFLEEMGRLTSFAAASASVRELYKKLLAVMPDLDAGRASLTLWKPIPLTGAACGAFRALARRLLALELRARLDNTAGVYQVMARYEAAYDRLVRATGALTFGDITRVLAGGGRGRGPLSGRVDAAARLYIDYRLDGHFDHWLLDEFQDTSLAQWKVIQNLVDEVMQAPAGEKSFFYVGDVKQSIYGWRGGEPALFEGVYGYLREQYGPEAIERVALTQCRRSGREVVAAVNTVFGAVCAKEGTARMEEWFERLGDRAEHGWRVLRAAADRLGWAAHAPNAARRGVVELLEVPRARRGGGGDGEEEEGAEEAGHKARAIAAVLERVKPFERGDPGAHGSPLSVAVLMRTNAAADALAAELKRLGLRTSVEGAFPIVDNPLVAAFVSLARLAGHPADTFALEHLRMTPLAPLLVPDARRLSAALCAEIHAGGFAGLVAGWGARLRGAAELDAFAVARLEQLEQLARDFDAGGSRNALEFVEFVAASTVPSTAGDRAVQVMTVHKAKGLGFDVVFLPELDGTHAHLLQFRGGGLKEKRAANGLDPAWCLFPPCREAMALVPPLDAACFEWDAAHAFESLCVLYVGMTRAARALYLVVEEPGKSSSVVRPADLARLLTEGAPPPAAGGGAAGRVLFRDGDADWAAALPAAGAAAAAAPAEAWPVVRHRGARRRQTPSGQEKAAASLRGVFDKGRGRGREVGSGVHELLQGVEWWRPDLDARARAAAWVRRGAGDEAARREVAGVFEAALAQPAVRSALARPEGDVVLWRERRFEIILGGAWYSGTFDRVVWWRDAAGRPARAAILDFKTDDVRDAASMAARVDTYRGQVQAYRQVLERLLGLPADAIRASLLFVRAGQVVEV